MPRIRYAAGRNALEFPLEVVIAYVQDGPERPARAALLAWLRAQAQAGEAPLEVPPSLRGREWNDVVASLLGRGTGSAFCAGCNQALSPPAVRVEEVNESGWSTGVMWGVSGRRVVCHRGHELLWLEHDFGYA